MLPVPEKARDLRITAESRVCFLETELSMIKHREASFDGAVTTVNKELSAAQVECAVLLWSRDKALLKLKALETDIGKSLKVCPNGPLRVLQ